MNPSPKFPLLVFAGLVLMQAAWIFTLPAFRASDEFDHVYRATGVALGEWRLSVDTPQGRGLLVTVPGDLVAAASAQCDYLPYPGPDNCFPVETLDGGFVTVSTAAADYNPAYYFVLGTAASGFEGANADYAMRATAAFLSSLGAAAAAWCLALARAGRWARFGFLAALSPVLVYTTIIPAPNAMEIVAGLCLWTSLWGLLCRSGTPRQDLFLLGVATAAGSVMATVRYIGPMWLGFIVICILCFAGKDALADLSRRAWRPLIIAVVVVIAAVSAGAWWTLSADLVGPTEDLAEHRETRSLDLGLQPVVWVMQMIAAFPIRGDMAPPEVYAAYFLPLVGMVIAGLKTSRGRHRGVIAVMTVMVLLFPVVLTVLTADEHGVIWQGRYQLGFASGLLILCGVTLDDAGAAPRERARLTLLGALLFGLSHSRAIVHVLLGERARPPSVADVTWPNPPWPLVAVMIAAGFTLLAWGTRLTTESRDTVPEDSRV